MLHQILSKLISLFFRPSKPLIMMEAPPPNPNPISHNFPPSYADHLLHHHPPPPPHQSNYVVVPLYFLPPSKSNNNMTNSNARVAVAFFLLFLGAVVFFLWPTQPDIQVSRLRLQHVRIHTIPRVAIDVSMAFKVRICNVNFYSMKYDSIRVAFGYRGKELGEVRSAEGHVQARGSSNVDAVLKFDSLVVLHDVVSLIKDLRTGVVGFDTTVDLHGRMVLFFFVIPVKAKISCEVQVNLMNQTIIRQNCYREDRTINKMPTKIQKSLQDALSKIKIQQRQLPPVKSFSSSTSRIFSGCKHPKTLSFAVNDNHNSGGHGDNEGHDKDAASLSDIDRFLQENFRSLYGNNEEDDDNGRDRSTRTTTKVFSSSHDKEIFEGKNSPSLLLFESPRLTDPPPDNLCGSNRFFVTPVISSSLMEEARASLTFSEETTTGCSSSSNTTATESPVASSLDEKELKLPEDCVAVLTSSSNPYDDFKKSMHEMIDARIQNHARVDWEYMEELLFSFLNLNEKKSHKYILSAFVDLVVVLRQDSGKVTAKSRVNPPPGNRRRMRYN